MTNITSLLAHHYENYQQFIVIFTGDIACWVCHYQSKGQVTAEHETEKKMLIVLKEKRGDETGTKCL